jgi:hypothetical protein
MQLRLSVFDSTNSLSLIGFFHNSRLNNRCKFPQSGRALEWRPVALAFLRSTSAQGGVPSASFAFSI